METVQNQVLQSSRYHDELCRTLLVLDHHLRTLRLIFRESLGNIIESAIEEQYNYATLYLTRDVELLPLARRLDSNFSQGYFDTLSAMSTPASDILSTREALWALIVRCHRVRNQLYE